MKDNFEIKISDNIKTITIYENLVTGAWMNDLVEEAEKDLNSNVCNIIVDLHKVALISSTGISILVNMLTKARRLGGDVVICAVSEKVEQLLLITKLNTIFNIKNSVEDAKSHFKNN